MKNGKAVALMVACVDCGLWSPNNDPNISYTLHDKPVCRSCRRLRWEAVRSGASVEIPSHVVIAVQTGAEINLDGETEAVRNWYHKNSARSGA